MNNEEFSQKLNERKRLYKDVARYMHIERLGSSEVDGILTGSVYVFNKIDGANLTVYYDSEINKCVIMSRNQVVSIGEEKNKEFNGATEYVLAHEGIQNVIRQGYILRGEWLVPHTIRYHADCYKKFYVFDVEFFGKMLSHGHYIPILAANNILYIDVLAGLDNPTIEELEKLVEGPDIWGATQKEGIVIKNYDFTNKYGRQTWAKIVHSEFKEQAKIMMGCSNNDAPETVFISRYLTEHMILKTIDKIKNEKGQFIDKNIFECLGRVWHDLVNECIWDFIVWDKTKEFNFFIARKNCDTKARAIILRYLDGHYE